MKSTLIAVFKEDKAGH